MDLATLKRLCEQVWPVAFWPTGPGHMFRMTLRETKDGQRIVKARRRAPALQN
jgi:hypothetical protein